MLTDVVDVKRFDDYGFECVGLFAKEDLPAGTAIWVYKWPYESFTRAEIEAHPGKSALMKFSYMADDDRYESCLDPQKSSLSYYFNHSCHYNSLLAESARRLCPRTNNCSYVGDPNCWFDTDSKIVTMIPVRKGEPLTYDYALTETESSLHYGMKCLCGKSNCRGVLTFDQWRSRAFVKKYYGHLSEFIWRKHCENSWYDPRAELRSKANGELGMFCRTLPGMEFRAGDKVLVFSGKVVHRTQLLEEGALSARDLQMSLQVDSDLVQIPAWKESGDFSETTDYINHSCDPSCGMLDSVTVVALRDIELGEEITIDYAMVNDGLIQGPSDNFKCLCMSPWCRGEITSNDWKIVELQKRYGNFFSPFLCNVIANFNKKSEREFDIEIPIDNRSRSC
uniref:Histone-lysine N-methyltransferase n=2 Tax=Spongospora subterranea TaxID=70186 RepID=A0A0H5R163_9EUKA|eukprot:CRZ07925.1 hypothetical protein [Spongospora subterranea]